MSLASINCHRSLDFSEAMTIYTGLGSDPGHLTKSIRLYAHRSNIDIMALIKS